MNDTHSDRFHRYRATRSRAQRNDLIKQYRWLAASCARRFAGKGEPVEDLTQVAEIGLLKAVERYDPTYGTRFSTFAVPTIVGELRRYFRDSTWTLRVPRRIKDLHVELRDAIEQLTHRLRRPPRPNELARHLGVPEGEVIETLDAENLERMHALDRDDERTGMTVEERAGVVQPELEGLATNYDVRQAIARLPKREARIVYLRFYEGLTQSEIAARTGVSQVHVSRLLRGSLEALRESLMEDAPELAAKAG